MGINGFECIGRIAFRVPVNDVSAFNAGVGIAPDNTFMKIVSWHGNNAWGYPRKTMALARVTGLHAVLDSGNEAP